MVDLNEFFQTADWKKEKHAPVIDIKHKEPLKVKVSVGKEIPHPNTVEHHIRWIQLLFHPEGEKFPVEIGKLEFNSHGEFTKTEPEGHFFIKTAKPGTLIAFSFCNIHGFWKNEQPITL